MVSDDHEEGIVVPGLLTRCLEELPERHVGIGYCLVHRYRPLGQDLLVLIGHDEGVVRGEGELCSEEGLRELT